jgi:tRNA U34 5-carboxymethylaminomethyl modifying enzyme MnmG/GidA
MPLGYQLGLVSDVRWQKIKHTMELKEREMERLKTRRASIILT